MNPSDGTLLLVLAHLVATMAMVGLIWFVQVVHYPLFAAVGEDRFVAYENEHTRRTGFVVGAPMTLEGGLAVWFAVLPPDGLDRWWGIVGLALLGVVHASTVFLQVPQHTALSERHDPARIRRLVRTNWIRTVGWTARGALAVAMVMVVVR